MVSAPTDPSLPEPVSAALFQSVDGREAQLVWNRRRGEGSGHGAGWPCGQSWNLAFDKPQISCVASLRNQKLPRYLSEI